MLGSLVAGAREVRAPLAVGLVLAAAWWFSFGKDFPSVGDATGLPAFIYRTTNALGTSVSLAAGTFLCYLLGSILVNLSPKVAGFFASIGQSTAFRLYDRFANSERTLEPVRLAANGMNPLLANEWFAERLTRRMRVERELAEVHPEVLRRIAEEEHKDFQEVVRDPSDSDVTEADMRDDLLEATVWRMDREAPGLTVRLQVKSKELYDEWDRLSAEADLRIALALPLAVLTVALAFSWSPWFWLIGLLVPLVYVQGRDYRQRAKSIVLAGLIEGVMESPTQEALRLRIEMLNYKLGVPVSG